ncbi:MAG: hypothetical protein CVU55_13010 [Deltaproteobacteria bacterium HGW-Deltaproteobacteria-13]|jgi:PAS domain S-box-containing protein|nr:MAG: hypothetical protein CVU55_13010 [Deltaproteobacteria bacterium HGW-Deltaproteobacteria-13]
MGENTSAKIIHRQPLRALIVDDSENDALLIIRELKKGGYNPVYERVETAAVMEKSLKDGTWDIILCDYNMPKFNAPSALAILKKANIDTPVIIVSGTIGEETAVECMRLGAQDYIMKDRFSRLCPAIARELEEARVRKSKKQTEESLWKSEERYRKITKCIPDLIWTMDLSGRFIYANEAVERTHGWTVDEYLKLTLQDLVSPQQAAKNAALLEEKLAEMNDPSYDRNSTLTYESEEIRKDGSTFWAEVTATFLWSDDDKPIGVIGITRDITEQKRARDILQESEKKYKMLAEKMNDIVWIADMDLRTLYITPSVKTVLGFSLEELPKTVEKQMTPESLAVAMETLAKELAIEKRGDGDPNRAVALLLEYYHQDGSTRWLETIISGLRNEQGVLTGIHGVSRDITQRRQAELTREGALEKLRKSEELYTKLVDTIPDSIVRTDLTGTILFVNNYTLQLSGYSREDMQGQNILKFVAPEDHEAVIKNIQLMMENRLGPREYNLIIKDGSKVPFEVNGDILRNEDGTPFAIVNVCRDIRERKRTEKTLRENEERLRGITQNLPGIIFQFYAKDSDEYGMSYANERLLEFLGIKTPIEDLFPSFLAHVHEEDRERLLASIKTATGTGTPWNFEGRVAIQSGEMIWFQGLATPTRHEDQLIFDGILLDITERKLAEEKFHKVFMTTPDCIAITRRKDGLLIDVNKGFEDMIGLKREQVIGTNSTDPPMNFWPNQSDRDQMVSDLKAGRDILHREFEFRRGDGAIRNGIYSARPLIIDEEECLIFILQDITEHKRMDAELQRTLDSLRKAFGTTMQVMISAIEMRDPYTAGHQKRCADVARAIASEMGLDQEKIDGIRMAGTIHDIGKLSIPAEILTKSTKLTKIEFSLIQEHSLSGYEMLKDVESPWPLAEIVYQHHERIDGSGYPRKLKGDEILIEARIMAVADVVEAMASHRPYRASLGVEAALEEIEKNKGIIYDHAVADACLRLFREKGYQLP